MYACVYIYIFIYIYIYVHTYIHIHDIDSRGALRAKWLPFEIVRCVTISKVHLMVVQSSEARF